MKKLCPTCKLPLRRGYDSHTVEGCIQALRRRNRVLEAAMRAAAHHLLDEKPEITAPPGNRMQAAIGALSLTGALDSDPELR